MLAGQGPPGAAALLPPPTLPLRDCVPLQDLSAVMNSSFLLQRFSCGRLFIVQHLMRMQIS